MIGRPRVHLRRTDSTNERAKALAQAGAHHGTLVTADEQSAGRGRQGRSWSAEPGSALLMSLVLRGLDERHSLLPLSAAVALCRSLDPLPCRIKWPNDVWIDGRKLAGILVEGRPQEGWAVLGIGLNVSTAEHEFPPELRGHATSLLLAGGSTEIEGVLVRLLEALELWTAAPPEEVLAAWGERDALRGRQVRWACGEGKAAGVDDTGALVVATSAGRTTLDAGEVHLLG